MSHLNLEERLIIENCLTNWAKEGFTFQIIGDSLDKDPTTISKEIKLHRTCIKPNKFNNFNQCEKKIECTRRNVCDTSCRFSCKDCSYCNSYCKDFVKMVCPILKKPPYVCNHCSNLSKCRFEKYVYYAETAQNEYEYTQSDSKTGINMTTSEFKAYEKTLKEGIKNNQSFEHIIHANQETIPYSVRSAYRHLQQGYFSDIKSIDLHNKVKMKVRPKKITQAEYRSLREAKKGHYYKDFLEYITKHPDENILEMDTVIGKSNEGACVLTFRDRKSHVFFSFKLESHTSEAVIEKINEFYYGVGEKVFKKTFPVILTDNGCEFTNIHDIEYSKEGVKRCSLFFCEPGASGQKGMLENEHRLLRYVIPKKSSFVEITQEDLIKIYNNMNSYIRKELNHYPPIKLGKFLLPKEVIEFLKLEEIPPNEVLLNPSLIQK